MIDAACSPTEIAAVVLCGGSGKRLGQDKAMTDLVGLSLLDRSVSRLRPQCGLVAVGIGDRTALPTKLPTVADEAIVPGGPLVGVLSAMRWASAQPGVRYLLTTPVDTPFLPTDLAARLSATMAERERRSAVAASGNRVHGLSALYDLTLLETVDDLVLHEGERMLQAFHLHLASAPVRFATKPLDPFMNVNTPDDLSAAWALAEAYPDL